jgi:type II secretory pathway pseudopilin PulG
MRSSHRKHAGFSLLEMMVVSALATIAILGLLALWKASQRSLQNTESAASLARVSDAFDGYIKIHRAKLLNELTSQPKPVTFADLRDAGLDMGFPPTNTYGQGYRMAVRKSSNGVLEAMVTTVGGQVIPPDDAIEIAQFAIKLGIAAGYSTPWRPPGPGLAGCAGDPTTFSRGAFGDWCIALSSFKFPQARGHVQSALFYTRAASEAPGGGADSDALHRKPVPGAPELNTMATSIDMANHGLKGTSKVEWGDGESSISGNSKAGRGSYLAYPVHGFPAQRLDCTCTRRSRSVT